MLRNHRRSLWTVGTCNEFNPGEDDVVGESLFAKMQNQFSEAVDSILSQPISNQSQVGGEELVNDSTALPLWKRILDGTIILATLPVTALVGLIVAAIIKWGSRGPVIFRQERVGHNGRTFTCYKFRTMHVGAEIASHQGHTAQLIRSAAPMTKLDSVKDSRIIPLGGILRSTGLDELPQLFNVWRGEMSLVGPRPCMRYEYDLYEPWQRRRFDAVPGLTGLWQVSGKNRTTFAEMISLDIEYSQRRSLWLDLRIMALTVPALVIQCLDQRRARRNRSGIRNSGSQIRSTASPVPTSARAAN
jgi:lipopolysaccharide/colanic/teichoic acid biosynthesis glycosyltransferase